MCDHVARNLFLGCLLLCLSRASVIVGKTMLWLCGKFLLLEVVDSTVLVIPVVFWDGA